jgi:hypothetical protein
VADGEPTRGQSAISTSIITWTSLRFDSIGGNQKVGASSSSASCSKPC